VACAMLSAVVAVAGFELSLAGCVATLSGCLADSLLTDCAVVSVFGGDDCFAGGGAISGSGEGFLLPPLVLVADVTSVVLASL